MTFLSYIYLRLNQLLLTTLQLFQYYDIFTYKSYKKYSGFIVKLFDEYRASLKSSRIKLDSDYVFAARQRNQLLAEAFDLHYLYMTPHDLTTWLELYAVEWD